jgi:hypothetical protein
VFINLSFFNYCIFRIVGCGVNNGEEEINFYTITPPLMQKWHCKDSLNRK